MGKRIGGVVKAALLVGIAIAGTACAGPTGSIHDTRPDALTRARIVDAADLRCSEFDYSFGSGEYPPVMAEAPFGGMEPILPGGEVYCHVTDSVLDRVTLISPVEKGSINGVDYRFWKTDRGGGRVQGVADSVVAAGLDDYDTSWRIGCEVDAMDDQRWCSIRRQDFSASLWKDGSWIILIGHQHFPGSDFSIRVDDRPAITADSNTGFSSDQIEQIMAQLKSGDAFLTRYEKWPRRTGVDAEVSAFGFAEAVAVTEAAWKSYEKSR